MACPCLSYPRTLRGVLSPSDRRHLSRLYLERVRPTGSPLIYYHLLTHLARHKDARAWAILERVRRVVRRRFGASFVVVNDFFSYRARGVALFQGWHQDGEFWLTADGSSAACSGLNLWILLDHRGMNRSFDVLDSTTARPLYSTLYAAARRGSNLRRVNRSAAAGIAAAAAAGDGVLNSVESLFGSSAPETNKRLLRPAVFERLSRVSGTGRRPWVNVPLEPGDALVLRQVELHRTDVEEPPPGDWRLAIGFKVMRRRAIRRRHDQSSPFGHDLSVIDAITPELLPRFRVGGPLPLVYNRSYVDAYDAARVRDLSLLVLLGSAAGRAPLLFILPLFAAVLCWAVLRERRARGPQGLSG